MSPEATAADATLKSIIEDVIPFNHHLGLKVVSIDRARHRVSLEMALADEHLGNVIRGMPHGGVVAALVDSAAGAAAALTLDDLSRAPSVATIDMRVDFVRPGRGPKLVAVAEVMRSGRSVIVVRTEVFDDAGTLLALGSSAFTVDRGPKGE